jgi:hypothetical protein
MNIILAIVSLFLYNAVLTTLVTTVINMHIQSLI